MSLVHVNEANLRELMTEAEVVLLSGGALSEDGERCLDLALEQLKFELAAAS